ncbi:hypothetical protein, partial [Pararhizobium polonicum]|uniref:hypothetical protein n=1 Tax=Pararhizobium polonicum TaxID=1612624 RepID=UPI001AED10DA
RLDPDLHVVIDDPLDGDQNFHDVLPYKTFARKCALTKQPDCRLATSIRVFFPITIFARSVMARLSWENTYVYVHVNNKFSNEQTPPAAALFVVFSARPLTICFE